MEELGQEMGNLLAGLLAQHGVTALTRDDIPSDRAGRYVVKLEAEDGGGAKVEVDLRVGVRR